jgi:hypothetical protein
MNLLDLFSGLAGGFNSPSQGALQGAPELLQNGIDPSMVQGYGSGRSFGQMGLDSLMGLMGKPSQAQQQGQLHQLQHGASGGMGGGGGGGILGGLLGLAKLFM